MAICMSWSSRPRSAAAGLALALFSSLAATGGTAQAEAEAYRCQPARRPATGPRPDDAPCPPGVVPAPVPRHVAKAPPPRHGASVASPVTTDAQGTGYYSYVSFGETFGEGTTVGAGGFFTQEEPALAATASHSLVELAVSSADGRHIVEIGVTVDDGVNGDVVPHLFAFHWVSGAPTCYNACGFVQTSATRFPGRPAVCM